MRSTLFVRVLALITVIYSNISQFSERGWLGDYVSEAYGSCRTDSSLDNFRSVVFACVVHPLASFVATLLFFYFILLTAHV